MPAQQPRVNKLNTIIPCPHEGGSKPLSGTLSDFHPMNEATVVWYLRLALDLQAKLLKAGKKERPRLAGSLSAIQTRLSQGIQGMTCPRPIDGEVARRLNLVEELYVSLLDRETTIGQTARRVHQLMPV